MQGDLKALALVVHRYTYTSLQNLAAPQEFYSILSVPLERSSYPRIQWCGTAWRVSIAGAMLFYWHQLLYPYYSRQLFFPFSSFYQLIDINCRAGVFGLIGCISLSVSPALPTSFNNNNNDNGH